MKILIAEDEQDIRNLIKLNLVQEGYSVYEAEDGFRALEVLQKESIDLAVLDVMMPRMDGFNLLRKIRETSTLPVIFLTARGEDMDKVLGLGLGADDYLVKPFSMPELMARIGAQLRRNHEYTLQKQKTPARIVNGDLVLDKDSCSVYRQGVQVDLNAKEYKLLEFLMDNQERVFTKKQLYRAVWEEDIFYDDNTIMVHISHLRTKLEPDPKSPKYIKTIRGIGYKLQKQTEGKL